MQGTQGLQAGCANRAHRACRLGIIVHRQGMQVGCTGHAGRLCWQDTQAGCRLEMQNTQAGHTDNV